MAGSDIQWAAACASCKWRDDDSRCRRNPPEHGPGRHSNGRWPKVEADDWCGRFELASKGPP